MFLIESAVASPILVIALPKPFAKPLNAIVSPPF
jgi:hypothetical protein